MAIISLTNTRWHLLTFTPFSLIIYPLLSAVEGSLGNLLWWIKQRLPNDWAIWIAEEMVMIWRWLNIEWIQRYNIPHAHVCVVLSFAVITVTHLLRNIEKLRNNSLAKKYRAGKKTITKMTNLTLGFPKWRKWIFEQKMNQSQFFAILQSWEKCIWHLLWNEL